MKKTKLLSMLVAGVLLISTIAACGKPGDPKGTGAKDELTKQPVPISIMCVFFTPEAPLNDNEIKREIEARTNTILNITWVGQNNYSEKVTVTLASGDIPDMILVTEPKHPQIKGMAEAGAFWEITPVLKDYKNLSALPKQTWDNVKIDGKNYGIPRYRPIDGGEPLPLIRKDWLDNLGMKVPQTMDELFDVMVAFTNMDPDGNGKDDTIGLAVNSGANNLGGLSWVFNVFNGATSSNNGQWKLKGDQLVDMMLEPETKLAIEWIKKAYDQNLIPKDFPTLKGTQLRDMVKANKAGGWPDAMNPSWLLTGEMRKVNPKVYLMPLPYLEGPNGKYAGQSIGSFGMFCIPKKVPQDKFNDIMKFMDFGASEEGWILANYGIKDKHYTQPDPNLRVHTEEGAKVLQQAGMSNIFSNLDKYARVVNTGIPVDFFNMNKKILEERAKVSVPDVAAALSSETQDKLGLEFIKKSSDLIVRIILGSEPMSSWDKYVEKLKADPDHQKMTKEINEAYKNSKVK